MTFELERFEWRDRELVLSGRWERRRRFRHVRLVVEDRRLAPLSQATGEDGSWSVVFPWPHEDAPDAPCLEAGHDLLIELPAPDRVPVTGGGPPEPLAQAELALEREALDREREALAAQQAQLERERAQLEAERAELEREREAQSVQRALLEREVKALEADRALRERQAAAAPPPPRVAVAGEDEPTAPMAPRAPSEQAAAGNGASTAAWLKPRPVPRNPLELPRQPGEPVRGQAPLAVRAIAIALCSGIVLALITILAAIF